MSGRAPRRLASLCWFLTRVSLRRTWRGGAALALVLGTLGGSALALGVGARRTATAYDRASRVARADDVSFFPAFKAGTALTIERVAAIDGVAVVDVLDSACADFSMLPGGHTDEAVYVVRKGLIGRSMDGMLRLRGRVPDAGSPTEALVDERTARRFHLTVGSAMPIRFGGCNEEPLTTSVQLRVVGIGRDLDASSPCCALVLVGSSATAVDHTPFSVFKVRLRAGADPSATIAAIQAIAPDNPINSTLRSDRRRTANAEPLVVTAALAAASGALGLAVAATVVLMSSRTLRARRASMFQTLSGLGLSSRTLPFVTAAGIAPWFLFGCMAAWFTMAVLSPRFPIGSARSVEPSPGVAVHTGALISALTIVLVLLILSALTVTIRRSRASARHGRRSSSVLHVPFSVGMGRRLARDRLRSTVGSGAVVALAVGALAVGGSAAHLVETPSLTGSPEDAEVSESINGIIDFNDATRLERAELADLRRLSASPELRDVALKRQVDSTVNGRVARLWGLSDVKGHVPLSIVSGHGLAASGEIVIGAALARGLHLRIGNVAAVGPRSTKFRVVGLVAATGDADGDRDGNRTAIISFDDYRRLYPAPNQTLALVRFAPGIPSTKWEAAVRRSIPKRGVITVELSRAVPPPKVAALGRLRPLLALAAAALGATAMVGLAQSLFNATRRRRSLLGTLAALGAAPRTLVAVVAVESLIVAGAALAFGVALGVLLGRRTWRTIVDGMGFATRHVLPWRAVEISALMFCVLTIVHAVWTARRAAHAGVASLRVE